LKCFKSNTSQIKCVCVFINCIRSNDDLNSNWYLPITSNLTVEVKFKLFSQQTDLLA